jgi:hypothetical protein
MANDIIAFTDAQFKELVGQLRSPTGLGAPPGSAPARKPKSVGFGCGADDMGPLEAGIYTMLAAGSPRLALAKARGVPLAPYFINVRAIFPDTSTTVVPDVGSDVRIVQDTLIDSLIVRTQNESTTANQNQLQAISDFFFGYQSGIEATLDVQGAPRYSIAPKFTPLSVLGDPNNGVGHWPGGWVLTYQQQLLMTFNAKILLPFAPLEVICSFRGWTPVTQAFVSMTNREAIASLQSEFGIQLDQSYISLVTAL